MKVIFLQHVLHVAKQGDIKEVSSGYATNFLFPKKLAKPYTQDIGDKIQKDHKKQESDRRMMLHNKGEMIAELAGKVFEFTLCVKKSQTFGSITSKQVAEHIAKKFHFPITKKHICFEKGALALKELGEHDIYVDLGENYATKAKVSIIAE